jgi:hypothetical protein
MRCATSSTRGDDAAERSGNGMFMMVILSMPQRVRHPRMRPDYGDIVAGVWIEPVP